MNAATIKVLVEQIGQSWPTLVKSLAAARIDVE